MSAYVKVGDEFAVGEASRHEFAPHVTAFADGSYLITWIADLAADDFSPTERVVKAQRYDASGGKVGAEFQVSQDALDNTWSASALELAGGGFIVTWHDNDDDNQAGGVMARLFDADGNALGDAFTVNAEYAVLQQNVQVNALSNGGFVVTWDDQATQRAQIFDATGARVGDEFATTSVGYDAFGDVIALAGGGFVVSWRAPGSDGSYEVFARVFDNSGSPVGTQFQLNTQASGNQYGQNLTALADGGFIALWETWVAGTPYSTTDVKGQRFDATGAKVGGEFLVNQQTFESQRNAEALALADGGFLVTWATYDTSQDGSGTALMARQYDAEGVAVGNEFQLNTGAAYNQLSPSLAALPDGRVLAAWVSGDWDHPRELRAQFLYNAPNTAPQITSDGGGASVAVTLAENGTLVTTVAAADADGPLAVSYWIGGGADASRFTIDSTSGELSFAAGPDFESPTDADADGVYEVILEARDGLAVDTQALSVTVTDVAGDGLSFYRTAFTADENGLAGPTLLAQGGDGAPMSYAIAGGADGALFAIDAQTGELSFVAAQDFEAPGDADGDRVYWVEVTAGDGTYSVTRTISVTLAGVNEGLSWISDPALAVVEGEQYVATLVASDIDGDAPSYVIVGGADGALFSIDGEGRLGLDQAPDFEAPADADGDNVYEVDVVAHDGEFADYRTFTVTVTDDPEPLLFAGGAYEVAENDYLAVTLAAAGGDAASATFSIVGGADAALFTVDYDGTSLVFAGQDFETPLDADGDGVYKVEVAASTAQQTVTATFSVAVHDVDEAPIIASPGTFERLENGTVAIGTVSATDPDGGSLQYRIVGGADASRLTLNLWTGALAFRQVPNFEQPTDAGHDNVYDVVVEVSDGTLAAFQAISITVENVDEAPVITSGGGAETVGYTRAENTTAVTSIVAYSQEGPVTYAIMGGDDAALFTIDQDTGALSFAAAPDFEAPADAGGDNSYHVVVGASDGSQTDTQTVIVAVSNVNGISRSGSSGSETLTGTSENDSLRGNAGNDRLVGLGGADLLTGGTQADRFVYTALGDSTLAASDRIVDFIRGQGDRIDLGALDANAAIDGNQSFSFIGSSAFSNVAGELRYFQQGGDTFVSGDVDGNGVADFQIVVDALVNFVASDFML